MERLTRLASHLGASATSSPSSPPSEYQVPATIPKDLPGRLPGPWHLSNAVSGHGRHILPYIARGHLHLLMEDWKREYGPIFGFVIHDMTSQQPMLRVCVSDPAEARRVLKLNPPKPAGYEASVILGEGVLSNNSPSEWARQRSLLKPGFATNALKELLPILLKGVLGPDFLGSLKAHALSGEALDIHEEISAYAFLMIGHSALGEEDEFLTRRAKRLREAFNVATLKEIQRVSLSRDPEYFKSAEEINSFTAETFQRYESRTHPQQQGGEAGPSSGCPVAHQSRPDSIISIIMSEDAKGCPHMGPKLRANALSTFMFAGHETTAHTLSWATLELAKQPKYQRKLQQEIDDKLRVIGGIDKLQYKDLFSFDFLTLVINETLRLWPVVANGTFRILDEDLDICGINIPKGSTVNFPHFLIHREKSVWGEDAEEFHPERKWFSDAFIPFTVSPRDCLGRNFAMMEMRVVLITIFSHFNVRLRDPDLKYEGFNTFTLFPEHGVWVYLEPRHQA